jgi:N-acetyl sugar amidotransferase
MSTRPRIKFNNSQVCNACQWSEKKKTFDWSPRQKELEVLLNKYKSSSLDGYDCLVPVSGGKDGSYVAYQLKHKYGMNPLTVTVRPALSLELGDENLNNFINSGYNHIHITPNSEAMRKLNKLGFIRQGFPYYGWLVALDTAVIQIAMNFNIPLIFWGEDGEVEYGGSDETKFNATFDVDYMKRIYLSGHYDSILGEASADPEINNGDLGFWRFPSDEQITEHDLKFTHWGYFEDWDSYRNYLVAKEHCGLKEKEESTAGTFTNFSQNDQALYSLHAYMMYLKFGFGRATQDAGIEIRRGAMTRNQALNLVKIYDGQYPHEFIELYLEYYKMTKEEFNNVLDNFANKDLFEKNDGIWTAKFIPGEDLS